MAIEVPGVRWDALPNVDYPPPANAKYPWDQWFDGKTRLLVKGEDFTRKTKDFEMYIREMASAKGHSIRIKADRDGNLWLKRVGSLRYKRLRHKPDPVIEAVLKGVPLDEVKALAESRKRKNENGDSP